MDDSERPLNERAQECALPFVQMRQRRLHVSTLEVILNAFRAKYTKWLQDREHEQTNATINNKDNPEIVTNYRFLLTGRGSIIFVDRSRSGLEGAVFALFTSFDLTGIIGRLGIVAIDSVIVSDSGDESFGLEKIAFGSLCMSSTLMSMSGSRAL